MPEAKDKNSITLIWMRTMRIMPVVRIQRKQFAFTNKSTISNINVFFRFSDVDEEYLKGLTPQVIISKAEGNYSLENGNDEDEECK